MRVSSSFCSYMPFSSGTAYTYAEKCSGLMPEEHCCVVDSCTLNSFRPLACRSLYSTSPSASIQTSIHVDNFLELRSVKIHCDLIAVYTHSRRVRAQERRTRLRIPKARLNTQAQLVDRLNGQCEALKFKINMAAT